MGNQEGKSRLSSTGLPCCGTPFPSPMHRAALEKPGLEDVGKQTGEQHLLLSSSSPSLGTGGPKCSMVMWKFTLQMEKGWEFPTSTSPSCFPHKELAFLGKASPWQLSAPICQQTPSPCETPFSKTQGLILTRPEAVPAPLQQREAPIMSSESPRCPSLNPAGWCWRFNGSKMYF